MGFNRVYKSLQEIFPQIDARVLRAVAIEHSKDADAAVEAVIEEIIPFFTEKSRSASPSSRIFLADGSPKDSVQDNDGNRQSFHDADQTTEPFYDAYNVQHEEGGMSGVHLIMNLDQERKDIDGHLKSSMDVAACESSQTMSLAAVSVQDVTMSPSETSDQSVVMPNVSKSIFENSEESFPNDAAVSTENVIDSIVATEDNSTLNGTFFQSSQIQPMDVLDEFVTDARNYKTTLFSAVESVISMMREVELKEKAVEQSKEEVSVGLGGDDAMDKVEELRCKLQNAKEANDMHAGEVYGEKAILATELRELQSRLHGLSEERDKSLALLDEMLQILEMRLAAAENEIKSADLEKLENQKRAEKTLADQEMLMEKVIQESNVLKQQAEENAKLREFLIDRGSVVDMLQGEISVISQDVKLIKEKFEELSKFVSSSQTSCCCILAAAASSSSTVVVDEEWNLI